MYLSGATSIGSEVSRAGNVPRVTAIVLNWCNESDTAACLESLLADTYPALQVLLVDNGSPDGSGGRLSGRFPQVSYLQTGANLGYTGGNNRGIQHAIKSGCDYVLILNNDAVVEEGCTSALVEAAQAGTRVGAVGGKILYYEDPARIWFGGGFVSRLRAMGYHRYEGSLDHDPGEDRVQEVSFLTGCCLLIPAGVLREVGCFEEDFFAYMEDVDFSLRLAMRGYRLLYQPAARILHRCPVDPVDPTPFQLCQRERNRRRIVRRRYRPYERMLFATFFYPSRAVRMLQYLMRGDTPRARAIWTGMTSS